MSVVYLIGGSSRSGKSTLAMRLLRQKNIPLLSTDVLDASFRDLGRIKSGFEDNGHQSNHVVQQLLEPMIAYTIVGHAPYVFEGIHLSPEFIKKMVNQHKQSIRACVLGFPNVTVTDKMRRIKAVISERPDWLVS